MIKLRSNADPWPFHPPVWINLRYNWNILKHGPENNMAIGKQQEPNITHLIGIPYCSHCKGIFEKKHNYIFHHIFALAFDISQENKLLCLYHHLHSRYLCPNPVSLSPPPNRVGSIGASLDQTFPGIHWNRPPWCEIIVARPSMVEGLWVHDVIIFDMQFAWKKKGHLLSISLLVGFSNVIRMKGSLLHMTVFQSHEATTSTLWHHDLLRNMRASEKQMWIDACIPLWKSLVIRFFSVVIQNPDKQSVLLGYK